MDKFIKNGLTFDDVLLLPRYSEVLPKDVNTTTNLTKNIELQVPILSAAMDTVTESKMAIAMANNGGLGVIHKNLTIEKQCYEVSKVKRYINGYINDPITAKEDDILSDIENVMREHKISGLPIVDDNKKLIGIITNRDLKYVQKDDRKVKEFMQTKDIITVSEGVSIEECKDKMQKYKIEKLPIVDDNNILKGYITSKDIDNYVTYKEATKDEKGRLRCGAAVGVTKDVFTRVDQLVGAGADVLVLDSAHGHSKGIVEIIKEIKQKYDIDIIAGNIATAEAAIDLAKAGADAVKVGIGPGSICTTRIISGVGRPQITAVNEVSKALEKYDTKVIADGGIKYSGDIPKAIAAGADVVMLGSMLAGTDQSPGDLMMIDGKTYKKYVGMGSIEAMKRGSKDRYFQGETKGASLISEGVSGAVGYKGDLFNVLHQLIGGLRSSMGYTGSKTISSLKTAQFQVISSVSLKENHPHSIVITNEQPNYNKN